MRQSMPTLARKVLSSPVLGDPKIDHATAATSGGTNSGSMLAVAMSPFHGVSVRTTTQENVRPTTTATAVPAPHTMSEFSSAACTFGFARTDAKLANEI